MLTDTKKRERLTAIFPESDQTSYHFLAAQVESADRQQLALGGIERDVSKPVSIHHLRQIRGVRRHAAW
jgi:hypothetical protein